MPTNRVTKTISGVKVTVDPRTFTDIRFIRRFSELMKLDAKMDKAGEDGDVGSVGELTLELLDGLDALAEDIFKGDVDAVRDKVAEENGGYLPFDVWLGFLMDVVKAFQKNPNARPAPEH